MITREAIIDSLQEKLFPIEYIYALWLEGADANESVDEYSDIDVWVDFEDDCEKDCIEAVEKALEEIAPVDYKYVMNHDHKKIRQRIYHLSGSSEYLMIDFCWQLHSRNREEATLIKGDPIEAAKVIFDKSDIIRYKEYDPSDVEAYNKARLERCEYYYSQHCRVTKYIRREQYLEAYAYYNRYVLEPLIDMLRLIYTPAHANYYLIHITSHIPKDEARKLEFFARISSLKDMDEKIPLAQDWFKELLKRYKNERTINK